MVARLPRSNLRPLWPASPRSPPACTSFDREAPRRWGSRWCRLRMRFSSGQNRCWFCRLSDCCCGITRERNSDAPDCGGLVCCSWSWWRLTLATCSPSEMKVGEPPRRRCRLRYIAANLRVNGRFYLGDERFPVVFTLLALAGLCGRRFAAERLALLAYFVLFFAIDLLFYAGSYNYGADVRYSLMTYPPLAILGGLGLAQIVRWADRVNHVLPAHAARDGRARVPVSVVRPDRPCDDRGSVGRESGRPVCEIVRSVVAAQLVRADAQSRNVPRVGDQCRADVADCVEPQLPAVSDRSVCGRSLPALEFLVQRSGSRSAGVLPARAREQSGGDGPRVP